MISQDHKSLQRWVIISGASISDYSFLRRQINDDDFIVACDSGLRHLEFLQLKADLVVGDFDSHKPVDGPEVIQLPVKKDDTDTAYAVKEGLKRGVQSFLLLGVLGGRIDHSLANLALMLKVFRLGCQIVALDDYSEVQILGQREQEITDQWSFFSLMNLTGSASGVCIRGALWKLENGSMPDDDPYGISNQVVSGGVATVSVKQGELVLVKVRRDPLGLE